MKLELETAHIHKIMTISDKTLRITLDLRELHPDQMAELMTYYMQGEEGVSIDNIEISASRSPSQRLRNVLYRLWEGTTKTQENAKFEDFYATSMEKIITQLKERL